MVQPVIPLLADAGVPMIFLTFPAMLYLLLPIIFIEAWLCRKWLGLDMWTSLKSNALANVASTLIGVPGAWAAMLCFEFAIGWGIVKIPSLDRAAETWHSPIASVLMTILSAAWLGPDEKNLYWMIPVAALGLLVPTYFVSVWIEAFIVDHLVTVPDGDPSDLTSARVRRAVRNANLISYTLLAAGTVAWLFVSLLRPHR
jgi:hypothetical protein